MDYLKRFKLVILITSIVIIAVLGITVAFLLGKEHNTTDTSQEHVGASDPAVDEFDPLNDPAVGAQSLAASILSYSPATDKSPSDGAKRVKDRLTGKYLKAAGDDSAPKPKQWNTWAHDKSKIHTVVKLLDNVDIPADATQAVIPIQAKTSVWHADGDQTPIRKSKINVHMVKEGNMWKLSDMEYLSVSE